MSDTKSYQEKNNSLNHQKVWVVLPAAGIGKRMNSDIPKQYLKIHDKTILEHTLDCFLFHPDIIGIIVVLSTDDDYWKSIKLPANVEKPLYTVEGGNERSDSVVQGLDYLLMVEQLEEDSWVMVHDAARPCLDQNDLDALLLIRSSNNTGAILASPVKDTMKRAIKSDNKNDQYIFETESREDLWHALTPQLFKIGELKSAINHCQENGILMTDESSALEAVGKKVKLVEGSTNNLKVTQQSDLELATLLLSSKDSSSVTGMLK